MLRTIIAVTAQAALCAAIRLESFVNIDNEPSEVEAEPDDVELPYVEVDCDLGYKPVGAWASCRDTPEGEAEGGSETRPIGYVNPDLDLEGPDENVPVEDPDEEPVEDPIEEPVEDPVVVVDPEVVVDPVEDDQTATADSNNNQTVKHWSDGLLCKSTSCNSSYKLRNIQLN